jgi:hypothetical protein
MGQDDFDADAICAAVERMDGQMTALKTTTTEVTMASRI